MSRLILIGATLVITAGLGYFLGAQQRSAEVTEAAPVEAKLQRDVKADKISESPRFQHRLAAIRNIERADLEELWAMLVGGAVDQVRLIERMIAIDPIAGLKLAIRSGENRLVARLMNAWSSKDPIAAFRYQDQLPEFDLGIIYHGKIEAAALSEAIRLGDEALLFEILGTNSSIPGEPFMGLSADQLRNYLDQLEARNFRHPTTDYALAMLAKSDRAAAEKWIEAHSDDEVRTRRWERMLVDIDLNTDFDAGLDNALEYVRSNPSDTAILSTLVSRAAQSGSVSLLDKLLDGRKQLERQSMVTSFVLSLPSAQRDEVIATLRQRGLYEGEDPRKSPRWPVRNEEELRRHLTAELRQQSEGQRFSYAVKYQMDPVKAAEVIATADPANVPEDIATSIASAYAGSDPEAALSWAATLDDSLSLPAARAALERWVSLNADAAMAYAVQLPESEFQTAAANAIVKKRSALDRGATREWVEELEKNPFRDAAADYFVGTAKTDEAVDLVPLANSIEDEALRRRSLLHLLDQWPSDSPFGLTSDPAIAAEDRRFLEDASFR